VSVSDAEVRAWYDGHPEQFRTPERRKMAHLVTATREEGEALRARIERGEGFEDLVRQYSTDPATSKKGGDLGWITKEQVPPEFAAVLGLASGEISAPLQSQYGWHLMRVEAIDPPRPMPFEEASGDLRKRLLEKKKSEERAKWVKALREATPVSIDEEAVVELARASNKA
jgi:parvulin-like peptidyl-prolyl isomerase